MRGESMKGKSKKSIYSTTFGIDPIKLENGFNKKDRHGTLSNVFIIRLLITKSYSPQILPLIYKYFLLSRLSDLIFSPF